MQCPTCGATLPDDARFCGACGTDLAAAPQPVPPPAQPAAPVPLAAPQYPPPSQTPPADYPPAYGAPTPDAQPPARKRNTGLIIGIVVGILVLCTLCSCVSLYFGIPAYVAFRGVESATSTGSATQAPGTSSQSGPPTAEQPTTEPGATTPEKSATEPAAEPSPETANPTLSEDSAKALALDYLGKANAGRTTEAKALVTSKYLSRVTSDYYDLAAKSLKQFEVVKVEKGQGGYLVFVKETWSSGVWTNWYLVVLKDGKLVINDTGTE